MKRSLALVLALVMLISVCLTACNGESKNTTTTTTQNDAEEPGTQDNLPVTLKIAGSDISEYTIVYARSEYYVKGPKVFTTEWDFYKLIAKDISEKIFALTGVTVKMTQDTKAADLGKEILVGPTNRDQSDVYDAMDVYSYQNNVKDGKLVVGGGYDTSYLHEGLKKMYCWGATYRAFDHIVEYATEQAKAGKSEIDLAEGFEQKGSVELKTVACVGDSITEGDKASDWHSTSWPPVLQRFLWKDYVVINYGKCGKTMRNNMDRRYNTCDQFKAAQKHQEKFDLALIMLGTNDFLNDTDYSAADDKNFKDSATEIVNMLTKNNSDLKLGIMNCPAYYGSKTSSFVHVRDLQADIYDDLIGKGYEAYFFDMFTFTNTALTASRYPDKLHPNDEGYALIGEKLSTVVPAILDGSWDSGKQKVTSPAAQESALMPSDKKYY